MAILCLVRHGQSKWNELSKWTGLTDIPLSETGIIQSEKVGKKLKHFSFDSAFTSTLSRAYQSLEIIRQSFGASNFETRSDPAFNERDYGDYTGKNKWGLEKQFGKEVFHNIRRGWNYPIPNGETLKDVYNRVIPFYTTTILPKLKDNKNILIVAHGNSIRALVKFLEHISDEEIDKLDIDTGEIYVYNMDKDGNIVSKEIKK